jgi:hypothetical protein
MCQSVPAAGGSSRGTTRRFAFGVWRSAFGVRRSCSCSCSNVVACRKKACQPNLKRLPALHPRRGLEVLKGRRQPTDLGFRLLRARKWSAPGVYCSRTRRDTSTSPEDKDRFYEQDIQLRLSTNIHFLSNIRSPWSTHFERSACNCRNQTCRTGTEKEEENPSSHCQPQPEEQN